MEFFAESLEGFQIDQPRPAMGEPIDGDNELLLSIDGVDYAIPDPEGLDSASFANEEGMTIVSDLDGDGRVDYVSSVSFDGHWAAWRPENTTTIPPDSGNSPENGQLETTDGGVFDPATPEQVGGSWSVQRWECVERGQWG